MENSHLDRWVRVGRDGHKKRTQVLSGICFGRRRWTIPVFLPAWDVVHKKERKERGTAIKRRPLEPLGRTLFGYFGCCPADENPRARRRNLNGGQFSRTSSILLQWVSLRRQRWIEIPFNISFGRANAGSSAPLLVSRQLIISGRLNRVWGRDKVVLRWAILLVSILTGEIQTSIFV